MFWRTFLSRSRWYVWGQVRRCESRLRASWERYKAIANNAVALQDWHCSLGVVVTVVCNEVVVRHALLFLMYTVALVTLRQAETAAPGYPASKALGTMLDWRLYASHVPPLAWCTGAYNSDPRCEAAPRSQWIGHSAASFIGGGASSIFLTCHPATIHSSHVSPPVVLIQMPAIAHP